MSTLRHSVIIGTPMALLSLAAVLMELCWTCLQPPKPKWRLKKICSTRRLTNTSYVRGVESLATATHHTRGMLLLEILGLASLGKSGSYLTELFQTNFDDDKTYLMNDRASLWQIWVTECSSTFHEVGTVSRITIQLMHPSYFLLIDTQYLELPNNLPANTILIGNKRATKYGPLLTSPCFVLTNSTSCAMTCSHSGTSAEPRAWHFESATPF